MQVVALAAPVEEAAAAGVDLLPIIVDLGGAAFVAVIAAVVTSWLTGRSRREERRLLLRDQRLAALVDVLALHHAWSSATAHLLGRTLADSADVFEAHDKVREHEAAFVRALEHARLLLTVGEFPQGLDRVQQLVLQAPTMTMMMRDAAQEAGRTGRPIDPSHPARRQVEAWGELMSAECEVLRRLGVVELT
ncbi:hypothetical protein [Kineococcus arenarius]|uniref:hypothetical protein n=1 Tax=unclassified Kineococcus TaxID=2621656 RepID=UPI003D7E636F